MSLSRQMMGCAGPREKIRSMDFVSDSCLWAQTGSVSICYGSGRYPHTLRSATTKKVMVTWIQTKKNCRLLFCWNDMDNLVLSFVKFPILQLRYSLDSLFLDLLFVSNGGSHFILWKSHTEQDLFSAPTRKFAIPCFHFVGWYGFNGNDSGRDSIVPS